MFTYVYISDKIQSAVAKRTRIKKQIKNRDFFKKIKIMTKRHV